MRHVGVALAPALLTGALLVSAAPAAASAPAAALAGDTVPAPTSTTTPSTTTTSTSTTSTTAPPASPPTAVTGPASSITLSDAVLAGNVDPNGTATSWYFQYGTTVGYGTKTGERGAGHGSASVAVSSALSGLIPDTTYHFRLVAANAAGTTYGRDDTFTTRASGPAVTTRPATAVGDTAATVHAVVDPNGLATVWYVRYGTSTAYGATTSTTGAGSGLAALSVSVALGALRPGTTYHYQAVARNAIGTSYGADMAFTTSGPPGVATRPATSVGLRGAEVHGVVDPNGIATSWYVRYGTSTAYGATTAPAGVGAGRTPVHVSAFLGALLPATTYHYDIVGRSAAGTAYGADWTFTTGGSPRPTTAAASVVGAFAARLAGSLDPEGRGATWRFQYGPTPAYGSTTAVEHLAAGSAPVAVYAVVSGLSPGTTYHFRLVSSGPGGTTYGGDATFTTPGPTLAASAATVTYGRAVRLSGSIPSGQADAPVQVYGAHTTGGSFVVLATVLTGSNGTWSVDAAPALATAYEVSWDHALSARRLVRVRPAVFLRPGPADRLVARVAEHGRLAGRLLRLQRLVDGRWRTVAAKRLGRRGAVTFRPTLPAGGSRVRALLTGYQAGPGYLTGTSAVHLVHRR
ncbi:MAG TPA: hypothetical protein VND23_07855 [Acidimicrobiales bacterium]|nr:hypothetical protein [Acidimicrobiales bacterium]